MSLSPKRLLHELRKTRAISGLGARWARPHPGPFIWGEIQTNASRTNMDMMLWNEVDELVYFHRSNEFNMIATIWPYADWDQATGHDPLDPPPTNDFPELGMYRQIPCDMQAYSNFVHIMVERYDGDGVNDVTNLIYPIRYWEVLNEPSMQGPDPPVFFSGTTTDYVAILRTTWEAIRAADSNAVVLNGGVAHPNVLTSFWQDVFDQGGTNYFDVFTFHSIGGPAEMWIPETKSFVESNQMDKQLWLTEVEFKDAGLGTNGLTQKDWADQMVKSFSYAFAQGIRKIFYVGLEGQPGGGIGASNSWLFLDLDPNVITQKTYYAYKSLLEILDYSSSSEQIFYDGVEGRFSFTAGGHTNYVLWGSGPLTNCVCATVWITDSDGNKILTNAAAISLSNSPIIVSSIARISGIAALSNGVKISWTGERDLQRYLERSSMLTSESSWVSIQTNVAMSSVTNYLDAIGTNSLFFYRIRECVF